MFDAYQAAKVSAGEKLFAVTDPSGHTRTIVHHLAPGERYNNSFAAITPNGQWLVSGEWNTMKHLLIFPTPALNEMVAADASDLPLEGLLRLQRPVRDVQGCTFVTSTDLLCSTDDPGNDLWPTPRQLLNIALPRPITGQSVTGQVTSLGELPDAGACRGSYEVEGIDYEAASGILRVAVKPPGRCGLAVTVYEYSRTGVKDPDSRK